jgi:16S rRNA (cytosine967-C5)-methyltransferase
MERGRTLDDALAGARSFQFLEGRDRAFARAIVSAALRRLGGIDLCLNAFLQRPIDQASPEARTILRCAGAQMLVLNTPPHAVVGESVALAKRMAPGQDKLINAVLRRLSERGDAMFAAQKPGDDLPAWLFARWRARCRRNRRSTSA